MLTIVGCGNLIRGDDGVGVVVARRLMEYVGQREMADVSIFDAGTAGLEVMFRARGATRLVVVDASRSGSEPGAIYRVPGEELARDYAPTFSLHDFRWEHALHAGRKIYGANFPTDITVFLIEVQKMDLGCELSEPVRHAADRVVSDIEVMIESHVATLAS